MIHLLKDIRITFLVIGFIVISLLSCDESQEKQNSSREISSIISKMSIEEKVGQMTQIDLHLILKDGYGNKDGSIDTAMLRKYIVDYNVGSILNAFPSAYDLDQWHKVIVAIQSMAKNTPNSIPVLYGIDAIHGATFTKGSTLFPHNIGIAATRNPEIAKVGAQVTAKEVRATGVRWNFDPTLGIGREPLWPRFEETFGEDVYVGEVMADAVIKGYEGDGLTSSTAVASCMKHFIGYSTPQSGKDRTPAYIPERQLREYYLPQFKAAADAGASTVMINSGEVNGVPVHASSYLLQDILRDELGFEGFAVTDWEDVIRLEKRHRVAKTQKEAVKIAVEAGIDMSMVPNNLSFYDYLVELVKEGTISEERLDESVRRILTVKQKVGLFENPYPEEGVRNQVGRPEYKVAAKKAALESITLLKNENNILPLKKSARVLVAGPAAHSLSALHSCWSYTWQGADESVYDNQTQTLIEGLKSKIGESNVVDFGKLSFDPKENYKSNSIKSKAVNADVIILALGEKAYAESPGVIDDLTLETNQLELAQAAIATGKPVILVLVEGRPRLITKIADQTNAILQAYRPASQGAAAIADVLFGDYNPSGKLPYSYPATTGDRVLYDHKLTDSWQELTMAGETLNGYKPLYPFGHGLSYTTFEYSDITLSDSIMTSNKGINVSVKVTNTGQREGGHAIELYTRDHYASITPSVRRLRMFEKISLAPNESKVVTFDLKGEDLSFVNKELEWITEEGMFSIYLEPNTKTNPSNYRHQDFLDDQKEELVFKYKN